MNHDDTTSTTKIGGKVRGILRCGRRVVVVPLFYRFSSSLAPGFSLRLSDPRVSTTRPSTQWPRKTLATSLQACDNHVASPCAVLWQPNQNPSDFCKSETSRKMQNSSAFAPAVARRHLPACGLADSPVQFSDFCTQKRVFPFFATKRQGRISANPYQRSAALQSEPSVLHFCNKNPLAKGWLALSATTLSNRTNKL